jgi:hypothetical protein
MQNFDDTLSVCSKGKNPRRRPTAILNAEAPEIDREQQPCAASADDEHCGIRLERQSVRR